MRTIHITRTIAAPPEEVFDLLADHAHYDRFRPIHGSDLLRAGDPAPNGIGALRRIRVRPLTSRRRSPPTTAPPGSIT